MSNLTNPPGGGDPPDRFRNIGEQIQLFFDFAENNPDRAVPFFVNIWETQASLTTRALALQGLGVAAQHYHVKEALADWDVLRDIAKEVKGKGEVSNDLTRWAAASALEAIGYSQQSLQHLEGGGFTEPLDRIRREIRDRKLAEINRIQRLNSRGETTAEYERHLEFWIYGPADELLNGNENSRNYADIVGDVISKLHGRGVYLGLISPNSIVQGAALRQAGLIFKESAEIEKNLYGLLEEFLHNSNHETSLRIHAAEIINTATDLNRRLNTLIKLLLEKIELRNAAVRLLTPYKHDLTRVEPDADTVLDALVFSYSLNTLQKPQLQDLTISQLETYFPSASQYHREISEIFTSAIAASEALARRYGRTSSVLKEFLQNKQDEYLSAIESWIQLLRNQISETETENRKVQSNQDLINEAISLMRKKSDDRYSYYEKKGEEFVRFYPFPIPEKVCLLDQKFVLSNIDSHTYNLSHQIQRDLKSIKVYLLEFLIEKYRSEFTSGSSMSLPIPQLILDLFEFFDLFRHPQKILFVLCFFAILNIFVAVHSGSQGFTLSMILLILLIGIIYTFIVNQCKEDEKELKDLQSIINKLKTQWKE
ncbi:hypothetical protein [Planktothrix agardhii]|uniref:hypothetical protein n=1 Tax=Planktothrix agardhii TaxID=1160 RepID=UPI0003FD66F4|nr:hypothetical protein [Planktothrix agardhii]